MGLARRIVDVGRRRARRVRERGQALAGLGYGWLENRRFARTGPRGVDARVRYPCYKSLDAYIDVERLVSLDGFLQEEVRRHLAGTHEPFRTGSFKKGLLSRSRPGARVLPLARFKEPAFDYLGLDDPDLWEPSPLAPAFAPLLEFIATLPFERTARMMVLCDERGRAVTAHRDHHLCEVCHEFVWFRTSLVKPFFVQDAHGGEKLYVRSYSAWFDTVNQFHGADAVDALSISVRVDGRFTEAFRARLPDPGPNRASRAALWAACET